MKKQTLKVYVSSFLLTFVAENGSYSIIIM